MVTAEYPDLQLTGETVHLSYVADPSLGHGQFRLDNRGANPVSASVQSAWLEFGERRQPLAGVTVYDLEQERMVDPQNFKAEAKAIMSFLVGFPAVAHEPEFGESTSVGLRLRVNGADLEALSPVMFMRRVPKR
jgi:hypothetical protein